MEAGEVAVEELSFTIPLVQERRVGCGGWKAGEVVVGVLSFTIPLAQGEAGAFQ